MLTLFGIFLDVMLKHAFGTATEGVYLWTRSDGKLFDLSRLTAKIKVQLKCMRDFLFASDTAVVAHSAEDLQKCMNRFIKACQDFGQSEENTSLYYHLYTRIGGCS